ncbi:MAG TPA: antibiotic biosynthesis monooxygenase [Acetobacteraceae bacterium]|nr:antibiotic biosynthesis monooxygenase [Acetobacteraceae bacterium]
MFAVLFAVEPHPERWDDYLRYAAALRPELERIDGFLDNRRFRSRRHDGRLLSLSLWRDEKSLVRWRAHGGHHAIQAKGRAAIFRDYHLRVGEVTRQDARALPQSRLDVTETGTAQAVSVLEMPAAEVPPAAAGLVDWDMFDGITDPQSRLLLLSWRDEPAMLASAAPTASRRLDVRIVRDYGLHDRAEAPQFHAQVDRR